MRDLVVPRDGGDVAPAAVSDALARLDAAVDGLIAVASGELSAAACEAALSALERHGRRVAGVRLKVLASAERGRVAQEAGFSGTESWVARRTTSTRSVAAREVALAQELSEGHTPTGAALSEGDLSAAHAAVILGATRDLPASVSEEQRTAIEQRLVEDARRFDPERLRRRARRVLEVVEPDQRVVDAHENELVRTEEETARRKCSLSLHDNGDGTVTGHFTAPSLAAAILGRVIDSMTAPRRMREVDGAGEPASFDWRHRRGLAFAELLEHLPTDHLHSKTAATVVVTIDHAALTEALKVARLDTGETISAGEARRLACGAGLIPAVLGGPSVALDLARESRLFSQSQRIAAGLHHDTCAAEGCERPYAWCELHHRQPWSHGGRTDLRDAVPLCHWHHQRIHEHTYTHTYLSDGSVRFRRRPGRADRIGEP